MTRRAAFDLPHKALWLILESMNQRIASEQARYLREPAEEDEAGDFGNDLYYLMSLRDEFEQKLAALRTEKPRTLIIACGALGRELVVIKALNRLDHLDITCLPAIWHNDPEKIPEGVRRKIRANRKRYDQILIGYGDCGTGGMLDKVLEEEGVSRIAGDHCYAFYAGLDRFTAMHEAELGTFYLTDYLTRHFDRLIIKGLGLDRYPQLRDSYFGHYKRVVYLAQIDDAALDAKAEAAAARLGLAYEKVTTGFGLLSDFLSAAPEATYRPARNSP